MNNKQEFEDFIEQMYSNAALEFYKTEEARLWQEKIDQMNTNCETLLHPNDRQFVTDCFELLLARDGQKELYVYRKGLLDCVKLLKWLGVLD